MKFKPLNILKRLGYWLFAFWLLYAGSQFIGAYLGYYKMKEKALYEELIASGGNAIATFQPKQSKDKVVTIAGMEIHNYIMAYTFNVDGKVYNGVYETKELPENLQKRVYYLKSDPSKNAMEPEKSLLTINESLTSKSDLWIGIGLFLLGIFMLMRGIQKFLNNKKSFDKNEFFPIAKKNKGVAEVTDFSSESSDKFKRSIDPGLDEKVKKSSALVGEENDAVISKEELQAKSKREFEVTDHHRFMPPSMRGRSEEE